MRKQRIETLIQRVKRRLIYNKHSSVLIVDAKRIPCWETARELLTVGRADLIFFSLTGSHKRMSAVN